MTESPYFTGQLLVAMPGMTDPRFQKGVIFVCLHDEKGAMGLMLNQPVPGLGFGPLLEQLDIINEDKIAPALRERPVFTGGPVESSRGFVLHDDAYQGRDTIQINHHFAITGTVDGLAELAASDTLDHMVFVLGYAGWTPGQLEQEIQDNVWLTVPANPGLIYQTPAADLWHNAFGFLGINPSSLSGQAGRA